MTKYDQSFQKEEEEKEGEDENKPEEEEEDEVGQPAKSERVVQRRGRWGARTMTRTMHAGKRSKRSPDNGAYM